MTHTVFKAIAAAACIASSIAAQPAAADAQLPVTPAIGPDEQHVRRAIERSGAEIAFARLAQERGRAEPVLAFAEDMLQSHTRLESSLAAVADRLGIGVPDDLHRDARLVLTRLETLSGPAFDQVYIRERAQDRMRHLNLMLKIEAQAEDAALRQLAEDWVPVLKVQLEAAQHLRVALRPMIEGPVGAVPTQEVPPTEVLPQPPETSYPDTAEGRLSP